MFRACVVVCLVLLHVRDTSAHCGHHPDSLECADYEYDALPALEALCEPVEGRPMYLACTIWDHCQADVVSSPFCDPFSLLGDLCAADGDNLTASECDDWRDLCVPTDSVVAQCDEPGQPASLMSTAQAITDVLDMCNLMSK
jgi:hypothetical protein